MTKGMNSAAWILGCCVKTLCTSVSSSLKQEYEPLTRSVVVKTKFRKTLRCTFKIVILATSGLIVIVLLYPYFLNYLQRTLFSKKIDCSKQKHPGRIILQTYEKVKSKN